MYLHSIGMETTRVSWFLIFTFTLLFIHLSEANHGKNLHSTVIVGTVYCDTCFQQDFSKTSHFISGASVAVKCGNGNLETNFYKEVKTNKHGVFEVHLPTEMSKHVDRIKGCSVKLIISSEPLCAVASSAAASSFRMKARKEGTHIFSAGFFTFKPLKQPEICNEKVTAPSLPTLPTLPTSQTIIPLLQPLHPLSSQNALQINVPVQPKISEYRKRSLSSNRKTVKLISVLPPIVPPILPTPAPTIGGIPLPPNPLQPEPLLPNPLQPPPASGIPGIPPVLPPLPVLTPPSPPPSQLPPLPLLPPLPQLPLPPSTGLPSTPQLPLPPSTGLPGIPQLPLPPSTGLPGIPQVPLPPSTGLPGIPQIPLPPSTGLPGIPQLPLPPSTGLPDIPPATFTKKASP